MWRYIVQDQMASHRWLILFKDYWLLLLLQSSWGLVKVCFYLNLVCEIPVIIHIRDAFRKVLLHRNITSSGHGFHTFRQSGATLAFDNNVQIQNIMSHGLWKSSAIWTYLEKASQAPSIIPTTFAKVTPSHF